jgi:hypothetical protein
MYRGAGETSWAAVAVEDTSGGVGETHEGGDDLYADGGVEVAFARFGGLGSGFCLRCLGTGVGNVAGGLDAVGEPQDGDDAENAEVEDVADDVVAADRAAGGDEQNSSDDSGQRHSRYAVAIV